MPADQTPPTPWVTVDWGLTLEPNTRARYERMAILLSNFTVVPVDRTNYYSQFLSHIGSWGGMVAVVLEDGSGGYIVTMTVEGFVDPVQLDNDQTGLLPMTLLGHYSEIYQVDATDRVTYRGASIPDGFPTQVPFGGMC
jgi:hypothetical protein